MYKKYPKYPTEGFEALYSRPPVIYVSASSKPGVSNYLCLQVSNFLFLFWDSAFVGLFREFISETIIDRENPSTYNWKLSNQSIQRKKNKDSLYLPNMWNLRILAPFWNILFFGPSITHIDDYFAKNWIKIRW